ncbi:MAG: RICIN domain-containing protein [Clostridia bacterium]|nr:RICIN domain-containing protein [Clostridia bacterium]
MKKFISVLLCVFLLSSISVSAVNLEVEGVMVDSDMVFSESTAYVPLSSIAEALGVRYAFDQKTQSAFINGINLFPDEGEDITVYVNGEKYTPSDNFATPLLVRNGMVYLPAHLAAEAVGMEAKWYADTATLVFTKKQLPVADTVVEENKTYAIVNLDTGKALTAGDNSLSAEDYTKSANQEFKFIKTEFDGYYHIQSVLTGKNLDVNSHGTTPGVSIITWDMGTGDNQKFALENVAGGTLISARSCHLPIEPKGSGVIQNTKTVSDNQKWVIIPFGDSFNQSSSPAVKLEINYTPPKEEEKSEAPYRTFSIGDMYLSDIDGLKALANDNSDSFKWTLIEYAEDVYVIENITTQKSVDVNARSLVAGDPIITWQTSRDTNQRWIFEKNGDGTYYIKSVHSALYLTLTDDNKLVQEAKNPSLKQRWTISDAY